MEGDFFRIGIIQARQDTANELVQSFRGEFTGFLLFTNFASTTSLLGLKQRLSFSTALCFEFISTCLTLLLSRITQAIHLHYAAMSNNVQRLREVMLRSFERRTGARTRGESLELIGFQETHAERADLLQTSKETMTHQGSLEFQLFRLELFFFLCRRGG
jgi:hypothetical protein